MWGLAKGVVSSLFGPSKTTETIVSGAMKDIDNAFYTDQEKAAAHQKILDFKLKYAQATQGQNLARRLISVMVTLLWALLVATAAVVWLSGHHDAAKYLLKLMDDEVKRPFEIILVFYFTTHLARAGAGMFGGGKASGPTTPATPAPAA